MIFEVDNLNKPPHRTPAMIKRNSVGRPAEDDASPTPEDDHKLHGGILQRWMARNGKLIVVMIGALLLLALVVPSDQLGLQPQGETTSQLRQQTETIPPCPTSPWKGKLMSLTIVSHSFFCTVRGLTIYYIVYLVENEDLRGKCPGDLKSFPSATSISSCANSCCANLDCITWQYRSDVGCLQGKDVRLGMEKDGVSAWCSDHPPHRWQGQYLIPHRKTKDDKVDPALIRANGCRTQTWNPNEQIGQCFGLGDVQKQASGSAIECMTACCNNPKCGAWQWNKELGCFYSKGMHGCHGDDGDPVKFDPFVGRRKFMEGRTYTDGRNRPWQMAL